MNRREEDAFPVVLFGSTHDLRHAPLEALLEAGMNVILPSCAGDMSAFSKGGMAGRLFRSLALPPRPGEAMLQKAAENLTHRYGERWLAFGCDDYCCEYSASLSHFGGVATFPKESAQTVLYKDRLRTLWNQFAVEQGHPFMPVAHSLLTFDAFTATREEILAQMNGYTEWSGGTIIKPNGLTSSLEVHRVESFDEGFDVIDSVLTTLGKNRERVLQTHGLLLNPEILVEEAIPRRQEPAEFSVEVLSIHGEHRLLGVTEKRVYPETHVEIGHTFPAQSFPESLHPHLVTILEGLLDRLKVQNCISHWEFIVTPDERLALVEGQLRPAGDGILILCGLSMGHNPYQIFLEGVSGGAVQTPIPLPSRIAVVRGLAPEEPLQQVEEIVQTATVAPDERLVVASDVILGSVQWQGPKTCYSRYAAAMATGPTQEEAEARCAALAASVVLKGLDRHGQRRESRLVIFDG